MNAVLLYNGYAVRTKSSQYDFSNVNDYVLLSNGCLKSFKIGGIDYELYTKDSFLKEHRLSGSYRTGYYKKESFIKYRNDAGKSNSDLKKMTLNVLLNQKTTNGYAHHFPIIISYTETGWGFELAKEGDNVMVKLLYQTVFSHYFNMRTYNFTIEPQPDSEYRKYKKIDDFPNPTFTDDEKPFSNRATGRFFAKNFGDLLNTQSWSSLPDSIPTDYIIVSFDEDKASPVASKRLFSRKMCHICFRINRIYRDNLLQKLTIETIDTIEAAVQSKYDPDNPNSTQYDALTLIDKVIGELLKDWGYLYDSATSIDASQILPALPNYREIVRYNRMLSNFQQNLKFLNEAEVFPPDPSLTDEQDSDRRMKFLHSSLISSLGILSIEQKIKMLENFMEKASKKGNIEQDNDEEIEEVDILYLLASVNITADADKLLSFLLKEKTDNGKLKTNFEILYYFMDDKRLDRIFIIQWFVDEDNNRQHFINALNRIWKISQYNYSYVPNGTTPNENNMNPNSFFLDKTINGGFKYFPEYNPDGVLINGSDPVFEFESTSNGGSTSNSISYKPESELQKEVIVINKIENKGASYVDTGTYIYENDDIKIIEYGKYHLYQPIVVSRYKADLELEVPDGDPIPAFLFFYAEEFDRLKDIDAAISFATEVLVEVGLFFATGGLGAFRHLRHLKSITKLRHLSIVNGQIQWGIATTEKVLFWRGLESGAEIVSVTAGVLTSLFNYQATTTNDPEIQKLKQKLSNFFLILTLCSAGKAIVSRSRGVKSADDVFNKANEITGNGATHNIPDDVWDVIVTISSKVEVKVTQIINQLVDDFPELANRLTQIKNGNLRLAYELSEIISKNSPKTLEKFNANPNIFDLFDDLTKVSRLRNLSEYFDVYYEVNRIQKNVRGAVYFPEFADGTSTLLHTIEEIEEVINSGINLGVELNDIIGLIIKSHKKGKQFTSTIVKQEWIPNYKNVLDGGLPKCFNAVVDQAEFISETGPLFNKYRLGDKVNLGGSSITKNLPGDLDLPLFLSPAKYDELILHYTTQYNNFKSWVFEQPARLNLPVKYQGKLKQIERGLKKSVTPMYNQTSGIKKLDTDCIFDFKLVNDEPQLKWLIDELKEANFIDNLNVKDKLDIDLIIFNTSKENKIINLPPIHTINL